MLLFCFLLCAIAGPPPGPYLDEPTSKTTAPASPSASQSPATTSAKHDEVMRAIEIARKTGFVLQPQPMRIVDPTINPPKIFVIMGSGHGKQVGASCPGYPNAIFSYMEGPKGEGLMVGVLTRISGVTVVMTDQTLDARPEEYLGDGEIPLSKLDAAFQAVVQCVIDGK